MSRSLFRLAKLMYTVLPAYASRLTEYVVNSKSQRPGFSPRGHSVHTFTASEGSGCQSAVTGFSVTNTCRSLRAWLLSWRIWRLWASNVSMKSSVGISRGFDTSQSLLLAGFWYAECEAI